MGSGARPRRGCAGARDRRAGGRGRRRLRAGSRPSSGPGDVVCATELRRAGAEPVEVPGSAPRSPRHCGGAGCASTSARCSRPERLVGPAERHALAGSGALAVDMESAWLAGGRRRTPARGRAGGRGRGGPAARRPAPRCSRARARCSACGTSPRRSASGPTRPARAACCSPARARSARASTARSRSSSSRSPSAGAPVYVRKQIVHNEHVVADLERRGAVFVEELDEVPAGATVVFSAHGVSPEVRHAAAARELDVIDATCPLVSKVHAEARTFAAEGADDLPDRPRRPRGGGGNDRRGTRGDPARAEPPRRGRAVEAPDPERVSYLTQTTLAVDETNEIVDALRARFPALRGPALRRHLLRDREPPARRACRRPRGRGRARRRLADLLQLAAPRRGRPARGRPRPSRRRRDRRSTSPGYAASRRSASPPARRRPSGSSTGSSPRSRRSARSSSRSGRRRPSRCSSSCRGSWRRHERPDRPERTEGPATGSSARRRSRERPNRASDNLSLARSGPRERRGLPGRCRVSVPLRQELAVGRYLMRQRLRRNDKFPLLVELEPLFQCNLACSFCGKIQYPEHILKKRMPVEQALAAIEESGAPMVSIAGGEPLVHPEVDVIARELIRAQEVRLPVHERDPDEEEARPVRAVAVLRLGRPPRRHARAARPVRRARRHLRRRRSTRSARRSAAASASTRTRPSSRPTRRRPSATCSTS